MWYRIQRPHDDSSLAWMGLKWGSKVHGWEKDTIYTEDKEVWERSINQAKGFTYKMVNEPPDPALDGMPKIKLSKRQRKEYKVVPFIPAGRERTMGILVKYLLKHKAEIDHVQIWVNTRDKNDLDYIKSLESDFFHLKYLPKDCRWQTPFQLNTSRFYEYTQDEDTIYIRFDDDIVYIDDDFFKNIVKFRMKYPQYLVVYANIWNNAIISHLQQKEGHLSEEQGIVKDYCMDEVGWANPTFAEYIHYEMLDKIAEGKTKDLYIKNYPLGSKKFSVSCFAIFGSDVKQFNGLLPLDDEEQFYAVAMPRVNKVKNCICGNALVSHFSFFHQRKHLLEDTNILETYNDIAEKTLADDYYKLLGEES